MTEHRTLLETFWTAERNSGLSAAPALRSGEVPRATMAESGLERTGRWSSAEHDRFLQGLELHGKNWRHVCTVVGTRSAIQTRTHAQKYLAKLSEAESVAIAQKTLTEDAPALAATTPVAARQMRGQRELQLKNKSKRQPTGPMEHSDARTTKKIKRSAHQPARRVPASAASTAAVAGALAPDLAIALSPSLPPSPAPSCSPSSSSSSSSVPTSPAAGSSSLSTPPDSHTAVSASGEDCRGKAGAEVRAEAEAEDEDEDEAVCPTARDSGSSATRRGRRRAQKRATACHRQEKQQKQRQDQKRIQDQESGQGQGQGHENSSGPKQKQLSAGVYPAFWETVTSPLLMHTMSYLYGNQA